MRPLEFFALAIWAAVMGLSASQLFGVVLDVIAYGAVLCALLASFRSFQRDQARISRVGEG